MPSIPASSEISPTRSPSTPRPSLDVAWGWSPGRLVESSSSWPDTLSSSQRGVRHRGGERPDLVERTGKGYEAVTGDQAVSGFGPYHAAE